MLIKKLLQLFPILIVILLVSNTDTFAATLSFYPSGGAILDTNEQFTVDVLINSEGAKLTKAKFTVLFDPTYLQLTKAEKNNSLFSQWLEDESSIDNDNGVAMLTGFTQSGSGTLYTTSGEADVLARLTFKIVKEGKTELDWQYETVNGVFETVLLEDKSPSDAANVLTAKPSSILILLGEDAIRDYYGTVPTTGISTDKYVFFTGIVLVLFGVFMIFTRPNMMRRKRGTVVTLGS